MKYVEVYHNPDINFWVIMKHDAQGYLEGVAHYEHYKADAVQHAEEEMAKDETVGKVFVYTRQGGLDREILKRGSEVRT